MRCMPGHAAGQHGGPRRRRRGQRSHGRLQPTSIAARRGGDAPPHRARPQGRRRRSGHRQEDRSTGTTRWCPGRSSTSRASRPSWTCSWCRCTPTAAADEGKVTISPRVQQNLGVRTAEVDRGRAGAAAVEAVGSVAYNERDAGGRAGARQRLRREAARARAARPVRKGQPLAELYVPDWVAAQEEYSSVRAHARRAGSTRWSTRARQRMRLAGMTEEQIRARRVERQACSRASRSPRRSAAWSPSSRRAKA